VHSYVNLVSRRFTITLRVSQVEQEMLSHPGPELAS
jgi:hypothetical protein